MDTIRSEISVQFFARNDAESGIQTVKKLKSVFESFLKSSFFADDGDRRGVTALPGPRSFSFRPASAKVKSVPMNVSMKKQLQSCMMVCQGLTRAIALFDELRDLREDPETGERAEEVLGIYTDSKEMFDMFEDESTLQWEGLLQSLEERVKMVKRGPVPEPALEPQLGSDPLEDDLESSVVETKWKVF